MLKLNPRLEKLCPSCSEYVNPVKVTKKEKKWLKEMVKQLKFKDKDALNYFLIEPKKSKKWREQGEGCWFICEEDNGVYDQLYLLLRVKRGEVKI